MEIILPIVYAVLLLLALLYSGVITYHVVKYRSQLPQQESKRALAVLVCYLLAGGTLLVISLILAGVSGLLISN